MKRLYIVTVLVVIGALGFASVAFALASGPPSADAWVDASTNSYNTTTFILQSSFNTGSGSCDTISWGYMKFDLTNMNPGTVGYADIVMRLTGTTAAGTSTTVTLYETDPADPNHDSWTEANVGSLKPALLTTPLTSLTVNSSTTLNTDQTFPSTPELVKFFQDQASGDKIASVGMKISVCGTSATVRFGTRENANPPQLHLRTAAPPNAVEVSAATAQPVTWPLYAGLAAVALFVVAGVLISRRRTA